MYVLLPLYLKQVLEYEQDKESQTKRVAELSTLNGDLQTQLHSLRHELLLVNTELRVHSSWNNQHQQHQPHHSQTSTSTDCASSATDEAVERTAPASSSSSSSLREPIHDENKVNELSTAARLQVQAAEAHASDLHQQ